MGGYEGRRRWTVCHMHARWRGGQRWALQGGRYSYSVGETRFDAIKDVVGGSWALARARSWRSRWQRGVSAERGMR